MVGTILSFPKLVGTYPSVPVLNYALVSTDHHLVVSWIRELGKTLDRPGKPKRVVGVNWGISRGGPRPQEFPPLAEFFWHPCGG